jgi:hypothetical protein
MPCGAHHPIEIKPSSSCSIGEKSAKTPNRSRDTSGAIFFGEFLEQFVE